MRTLPGTGVYADRLNFLGAVAREVPACVAELAELLTPARVALLDSMPASAVGELEARPMGPTLTAFPVEPWNWMSAPVGGESAEGRSSFSGWTVELAELNAAVAKWADRWNLSRGEAGGWVLGGAGLTLQRWATYRARGLCEGPQAMRLCSFEAPAWSGYVGEREAFRPFDAAGSVRARVKTRPGAPVELLTSTPPWHLAALARWQVAGEGADRAGRRWAELERRKVAPDRRTVTEGLRRLAERLELPPRRRGKAGRPRIAGR